MIGALMTLPLLPAASGSPTALESATVTEIKNQAIFQSADGTERAVKTGDVIHGQEPVKTEGNSMAELEFPDGTLARLGSRSALTFSAEAREVQMLSGLGVFFIPKTMGGLRIVARPMVGTVEDGTVVVEDLDRPEGGKNRHWTKFLLVEGSRAGVSLPGASRSTVLRESQGLFRREGASTLSPAFDFDVKALTENATILTGFHRAWPGLDEINAVIQRQYKLLRSGRLTHASHFWTGRGAQQGTLAAQFPVPDLPGMTTPPYNDSGARDGLLLYEFNNVGGSSRPTPAGSATR